MFSGPHIRVAHRSFFCLDTQSRFDIVTYQDGDDMGLCTLLSTAVGHIALLDLLVASGMACDRAGISWAEHATVASLSVALVKLSNADLAPHGWRIAALAVLLIIGAIGAVGFHLRSGELVVLSTLAVLLVVIDERGVAKE
jgi:hypothetical protein